MSPGPRNINAEEKRVYSFDVHSLTVVSAEQVEMALLSGLQLNAYYGTRLNILLMDEGTFS
jgi:hypothetical protein